MLTRACAARSSYLRDGSTLVLLDCKQGHAGWQDFVMAYPPLDQLALSKTAGAAIGFVNSWWSLRTGGPSNAFIFVALGVEIRTPDVFSKRHNFLVVATRLISQTTQLGPTASQAPVVAPQRDTCEIHWLSTHGGILVACLSVTRLIAAIQHDSYAMNWAPCQCTRGTLREGRSGRADTTEPQASNAATNSTQRTSVENPALRTAEDIHTCMKTVERETLPLTASHLYFFLCSRGGGPDVT